ILSPMNRLAILLLGESFAVEIQASDQFEDGQGARHHIPAHAAGGRRRGYRVALRAPLSRLRCSSRAGSQASPMAYRLPLEANLLSDNLAYARNQAPASQMGGGYSSGSLMTAG